MLPEDTLELLTIEYVMNDTHAKTIIAKGKQLGNLPRPNAWIRGKL